MELAHSINGVPIRLTYERWYHITENHDDLASHFHDVLEAIQKPDFVVRGNKGSLKAIRKIGKKKWLIVIYKEVSKRDGFVITAYFLGTKPKGKIIWRQ
jgi:S1-C subfamily serine protease